VAEADKFALDAAVAPARVLPGQLVYELPHLVPDRRASRRVGVRPLVLDQPPVPGQVGTRGHDPVQPQVPGQQPRQGGNHWAVSPVRFLAVDLAAQDRDLVPQYQDLHVLRSAAPREQRRQPNNRIMSR